jgi:hypothetical protein
MAQSLYCWRCDQDIPMLTEQEWLVVEPALSQSISTLQQVRKERGIGLAEALEHHYGSEALRLYQDMTGFRETNPDALWHHRLSLYGPPCKACGKPLRTPQAKLCAACGSERA